ncbi:MAG: Crp/Fnr family transcriptional regulator [Deltaproteobacteria bacterium]|nr:Crp/Fnr family transcriptional regulator [Deltaproteobacteria bacterium]
MDSQIHLTDIFSRSDLFVGIDEDKLSDIFSFGDRAVYEWGETLFREGDPAAKSYLVLKGRFKLSKLHEDGKEAIVRYINPGEMTAAVSVFKGKNYPATAQAVGPSEVVGWNRETMLEIMTANPQIAINLLGLVVERLDDIQNRYLELQAERVEQRLARALLRIMKQSGRRTDEGILIDFRLSRQDLADYTGTTLYTVSRTLSSWEKKGWVRSGRERIIVADPHALVSFAETG